VRAVYLERARRSPVRYRVIDAVPGLEEVRAALLAQLDAYLEADQ
jgi:thymidylate kinase